MGLARVPEYLLPKRDSRMSVDLEMDDRGFIRLEFRKREKDGKKPGRILWSVAPAMKCIMAELLSRGHSCISTAFQILRCSNIPQTFPTKHLADPPDKRYNNNWIIVFVPAFLQKGVDGDAAPCHAHASKHNCALFPAAFLMNRQAE